MTSKNLYTGQSMVLTGPTILGSAKHRWLLIRLLHTQAQVLRGLNHGPTNALAMPTHLRQGNTDALLLRRGCALDYERSFRVRPEGTGCPRFLLHAGGGTLLILMVPMFSAQSELRA